MITPLNLPKAPLKLSRKDDIVYVWCELRKKKLVLTPEEWVRQHVIHFLHTDKHVPYSLMSSEHRLNYNGREKRADLVVYTTFGEPELMVECKAPHVEINGDVLFQIGQYQKILGAKFLMLTNGIEHVYAGYNKDGLMRIENLELGSE